jgi:hypothetical protein
VLSIAGEFTVYKKGALPAATADLDRNRSVFSSLPIPGRISNLPWLSRLVHFQVIVAGLRVVHVERNPEVTSSPDRKKYWDLLETLRWIQMRDERMVAEIWDWSDDARMALAIIGMKVEREICSPPEGSDINRRPVLARAEAQDDGRPAPSALDDILRKVHSGRVRMTGIRCNGKSRSQMTVPQAELNDLHFRLVPGHPVAPVGLWSRSRGILLWRSPQFLSRDVMSAWPARDLKPAPVSTAILDRLQEIMKPEAPLTKVEARERCLTEVPKAYPAAFEKAWAKLDPSCKRGRGKHGRRRGS